MNKVAFTDKEETFRQSLRKSLYGLFSAWGIVSVWMIHDLWSAIVHSMNKHKIPQEQGSVTVSSLSYTERLAADVYYQWLHTRQN